MYKIAVLALAAACLLAGCGGAAEPQNVQMANPWQDYDSLQEAEAAAGFSFGLPECFGQTWQAEAFRVMNGSLLEVIYRGPEKSARVRKAPGSEDISGDYNSYQTVTLAEYENASVTLRENKGILIFTDQYSWSVYCEKGFLPEQSQLFLDAVLAQ